MLIYIYTVRLASKIEFLENENTKIQLVEQILQQILEKDFFVVIYIYIYLFFHFMQEENTFDLIQEIEIEMKKRQSNTPHLENSSCMSSSSS